MMRPLVLLLALCAAPASVLASEMPLVSTVESVGMTVADLERSMAFYTDLLAFEQVSNVVEVRGDRHPHLPGIRGFRKRLVRMRLGEEILELTEYVAPTGRPVPDDSQSHDRWSQHIAIVVRDMEQAYDWLRWNRITHVSVRPQQLPDWNPQVSGIQAFYFRDPDGHLLEIVQFPPDKGDPKWRRPTEALFLGIDHTAIVVAETVRSLAFYQDMLGLEVVGETDNFGPEQEKLNNIPEAHLRTTTLRAAAGPGLELLEYRIPRSGRPIPRDAGANDLLYWQTRLVIEGAEAAFTHLRSGVSVFLSLGEVSPFRDGWEYTKEIQMRDPDGHAMQLVAR